MKKILKHPLFAGSFAMIFGNNLVNLVNLIYHPIMGKILGVSNYGELAALLSLLGLIGAIPLAFGLTIVKFVSSSKNEKETGLLINWIISKSFIAGVGIFLLIVISSPFLQSFLKIQGYSNILLIASLFIFSIPSFFSRSVLQGLMRFNQMVVSTMVEVLIKLILGVSFVLLGWSVAGALGALLVGTVVGWSLTYLFLRDRINSQIGKIKFAKMIKYSFPVLVNSVAIISISSSDLVLVKHFFSSQESGVYAALSVIGKIIFFGAGPIAAVMFPIISQRQAKGEEYYKVFYASLGLTCFVSFGVLLLYWLFPSLIVSTLYNSQYTSAADLLIWFGIFMTLFTISTLFINFHLSLNQTKVVIFPITAAVLQIVGILFFHDNLKSVITISITITALLLTALLVYFQYAKGRKEISEKN